MTGPEIGVIQRPPSGVHDFQVFEQVLLSFGILEKVHVIRPLGFPTFGSGNRCDSENRCDSLVVGGGGTLGCV